jgi:predicted GTPase
MSNNQLSFVILGTVSAGKTTVINSLQKDNIGDTHIIKTTILPLVYTETLENHHNIEDIKANTLKENNHFIDNKMNDLKELKYKIKPLTGFTSFINNIGLRIYDIPGLNDAETKDIYYNYLTKIFININILVWVIDVNSAINTSDEIDICNFILEKIKYNKIEHTIDTKLIVLLNKCDNMIVSDGKFMLEPELQDMYNQAKRMIDTSIENIYPNYEYEIIPFSSEKTYIYRMIQERDIEYLDEKYLNKLGQDEFSNREWKSMTPDVKISSLQQKLSDCNFETELENTGFNRFRDVFQNYLNNNGEYLFLLDILKSKMINDLDSKYSVEERIHLYHQYQNSINNIINEQKLDSVYVANIKKILNRSVYKIVSDYEETILQYINVNNINY